jgi:cation:H+ antiporter
VYPVDPLVPGLFVAGLLALVSGAELLVRGAARLAAALGVSPLVIGLTVVAWGTSTPELAVSLQAGVRGAPDLAIGNVVGSNIANVLLVLGLCAVIRPLPVEARVVRREVPMGIAASFAVLALAWDGRLGRLDGALLTAGMAAYTAWVLLGSRRERAAVQREYAGEFGPGTGPRSRVALLGRFVQVAAGVLLLVLGARWLVRSAVAVAGALGIGEAVVGLTVVAVGTSLPELATSVVAAWRREGDIAIGNAVGSSLYNLLAILGLASLVTPGGLAVAPPLLRVDLPVMTAVAVACLPILFTDHLLARWEGALFLAYYGAYTLFLFLDAAAPSALPAFSVAMLGFVIPITAMTIAVLAVRAWRASG